MKVPITQKNTTEGLFATEKEANEVSLQMSKNIGTYITSIKVKSETEFCWALTNKFDPAVSAGQQTTE